MRKLLKDRVALAEKRLKITFTDKDLLKRALTHRSVGKNKGKEHGVYEKLEFLGDSLLNFIVTDFIFHRFPKLYEGDLAKLRANLVNSELLAKVAERMKLGECLFMGRGAEQEGGRTRVSILGDSFEAILGAVYLDQGLEVVRDVILRILKKDIFKQVKREEFADFKTAFQEYAVKRFGVMPVYEIVREEGPTHAKVFFAEVRIKEKVWGKGRGASKKKAEQKAAESALKSFKKKFD